MGGGWWRKKRGWKDKERWFLKKIFIAFFHRTIFPICRYSSFSSPHCRCFVLLRSHRDERNVTTSARIQCLSFAKQKKNLLSSRLDVLRAYLLLNMQLSSEVSLDFLFDFQQQLRMYKCLFENEAFTLKQFSIFTIYNCISRLLTLKWHSLQPMGKL